jgi:putative peptidoglycan lipid II flippase
VGRYRSLVIRIARVTGVSALARAPGFLVPVLMAAFFGAGPDTDAYFLAYSTLVLVSLGNQIEITVVPFAAQALRSGPERLRAGIAGYAAEAVWWGFGAVAAGALLLFGGIAFTRDGAVSIPRTLLMFTLLAPTAIASCVGGVYSGTLVAGFRLERTAASNAFRGLGGLAGVMAAAAVHRLWPIPIGLAAGEFARMLWLRAGARSLAAAAVDGAAVPVEKTFRRAAAYQASVQMLFATPTLERLFVSGIPSAISHVEYAVRVITIATIAFDGGLAPWLLARWTNQHSDGQLVTDWRGVYRPLAVGAALATLGGVLLAALAPLCVRVLFQRGAFHASDAAVVSSLLRWYAPGFAVYMTGFCLERLILARGENALFLRMNVLRTGVRLAVVLVGLPRAGMYALPIALLAAETAYLVAGLVATRAPSRSMVAG